MKAQRLVSARPGLRGRRGTALLMTTIMSFMIVAVCGALLSQGVSQMRQMDAIETDLARTYAAESVLADVEFQAAKSAYDVTGNASDPLYTYNVNRPVNLNKAKIHGWELGGQYFFGETGFGVSANYTIVKR